VDLNEAIAENPNVVLSLTLDNHDPYDEFAWVQGWRFALCDFLLFERGELVEGFYTGANEAENSYEFETLQYENPSTEDALKALSVLDSYREWLGAEGRDY
jgi:hypothetical protein